MNAAQILAPTAVPATEPQHMQALARANRVRLARAALKRAVTAENVRAADIVRECPWEAESMAISELLTSQRRWGRTRARKFLFPLGLGENKRLGTLTQRQRALLASALDGKALGDGSIVGGAASRGTPVLVGQF